MPASGPHDTVVEPTDFRGRLASVDRQGRRTWIYAGLVIGRWWRRRRLTSWVLIAFYCALPFLRTPSGEPWLRIDIPNRHYIVWGQTYWPQDFFYVLLGVLAFFVATLLLVSIFGRVYCGWLCPHNIFLEVVYRRIEALCEGPAHRRRLQDARKPWPPGLLFRKAAKWLLFILATGALANAATAIFVGTESFRWGLFLDPVAHPAAALFFAITFALILFNFAWFREQTCLIVCPYGRWQATLLDRDTLTVAYDAKRGEPRGRKGATTGDCVDCKLCVDVCPTGIDIRNGVQLECINCTACIDACDSVMTKIGKPRGLIRYASENSLEGKPLRLLRPRAAIYAAALLAITTVFLVLISHRPTVLVTPLRTSTPPALDRDAEGHEAVRNVVRLTLINRARTPRTMSFSLDHAIDAELYTQPLELPPNEQREQTLIVRIPRERFAGSGPRHRLSTVLTVSDDRGEKREIPLVMEAP